MSKRILTGTCLKNVLAYVDKYLNSYYFSEKHAMKNYIFGLFLIFTSTHSTGQISANANNHISFLDIDLKLPYSSVKASLLAKGFIIDKKSGSAFDKTEEAFISQSLGYRIEYSNKYKRYLIMLNDNLPTLEDIDEKFMKIYKSFEGMFDHSEITTTTVTKGDELIGKTLQAAWKSPSAYLSLDFSYENYGRRASIYINPN